MERTETIGNEIHRIFERLLLEAVRGMLNGILTISTTLKFPSVAPADTLTNLMSTVDSGSSSGIARNWRVNEEFHWPSLNSCWPLIGEIISELFDWMVTVHVTWTVPVDPLRRTRLKIICFRYRSLLYTTVLFSSYTAWETCPKASKRNCKECKSLILKLILEKEWKFFNFERFRPMMMMIMLSLLLIVMMILLLLLLLLLMMMMLLLLLLLLMMLMLLLLLLLLLMMMLGCCCCCCWWWWWCCCSCCCCWLWCCCCCYWWWWWWWCCCCCWWWWWCCCCCWWWCCCCCYCWWWCCCCCCCCYCWWWC